MKKVLNVVFWVAVIAVVAVAAYTMYSRNKAQVELEQIDKRVEIPDFTLKDLNGKSVKLSDYKGKVVFLNFWATWCPYCIKEMGDLNRANERLAKEGNAVVLAVNIQEDASTVKKYIEDKKLTMPVLLDTDGSVAGLFGVSGIPVTFVINRDGTLYNYIGGAATEKVILGLAKKIK